eukprot:9470000-Pyramimonas_sp.AAC.1
MKQEGAESRLGSVRPNWEDGEGAWSTINGRWARAADAAAGGRALARDQKVTAVANPDLGDALASDMDAAKEASSESRLASFCCVF